MEKETKYTGQARITHTFSGGNSDQEKLEYVIKQVDEAKIILKELIEMYMVNVDADSEPKASIHDMVELWKRASRFIQ